MFICLNEGEGVKCGQLRKNGGPNLLEIPVEYGNGVVIDVAILDSVFWDGGRVLWGA